MRIGIDLGGSKIAGIVLDDAGQVVLSHRQPTPGAEGYPAVLDALVGLIGKLEREAGCTCSIGIGTPGQVSRLTGTIKNSNAACLNQQPLLDDLRQRLHRDVRLANDANCFALSEATDGAAAAYGVVFGVILGSGVGGGITIGRRVLAGLHGIAGEWGHFPLEAAGPLCYCGRRGCTEVYLSGAGLLRDYRAAGGKLARDAAHLASLAQMREDVQAAAAIDRYSERLGRALATVVNVVDPDAIVLGGGLSNIATLYEEGRRHMRPHVFNDELRTPLLRHAHGDASGVRGAAMLWPAARSQRARFARGGRSGLRGPLSPNLRQ